MTELELNNHLFLKAIEEHERGWGIESYTNRPSLFEIMSSPVIVLWETPEDEKNLPTITLHQSLEDIEKHFLRILVASAKNAPQKRIIQVFENQQKVVVKGVKIIFGKSRETQK